MNNLIEWLISMLPPGDTGEFLTGVLISTGMVTADAFLWQIAAIPALVMLGLKLRGVILISTMIALAHQFYGMLGLFIRSVGGPAEAVALAVILALVTYLIWGFVFHGSIDDGEEDKTVEKAQKLLIYGIISFAAFFGIYTGVSIDELFAVLGRVEWMTSQGWSYWVMLANITVAMALLWLILAIQGVVLYALTKRAKNTEVMQWILHHEDKVMFLVFSLLVYFIHRGWWQNVLGYEPVEFHIGTNNTGFAYWVYIAAGFVPMLVLRILIRFESAKDFLLWFFGPQQKLIDALEEWSEKRADKAAPESEDTAA